MSSGIKRTVKRAGQWLLAAGIVVVSAVKGILLWPLEVLGIYSNLGKKRREDASEGDDEEADD